MRKAWHGICVLSVLLGIFIMVTGCGVGDVSSGDPASLSKRLCYYEGCFEDDYDDYTDYDYDDYFEDDYDDYTDYDYEDYIDDDYDDYTDYDEEQPLGTCTVSFECGDPAQWVNGAPSVSTCPVADIDYCGDDNPDCHFDCDDFSYACQMWCGQNDITSCQAGISFEEVITETHYPDCDACYDINGDLIGHCPSGSCTGGPIGGPDPCTSDSEPDMDDCYDINGDYLGECPIGTCTGYSSPLCSGSGPSIETPGPDPVDCEPVTVTTMEEQGHAIIYLLVDDPNSVNDQWCAYEPQSNTELVCWHQDGGEPSMPGFALDQLCQSLLGTSDPDRYQNCQEIEVQCDTEPLECAGEASFTTSEAMCHMVWEATGILDVQWAEDYTPMEPCYDINGDYLGDCPEGTCTGYPDDPCGNNAS